MDKTLFAWKQQWIDELGAGDEVRGLFLLGAASQQQARNGPFWRLELRDATGSLEARIWSPASQQYTDLTAGSLAEVEGRAESFKEQLQVNVTRLRVLTPDEMDAADTAAFLPSSARPPSEMLAELETLCRSELTHKPWRTFALAVLNDADVRLRLLAAPAAKGVHHAWVGGLLEHTLSVARLCLQLATLYPHLDRQTLFVGAIFHDLGKVWELTGGLGNDYTDEGRLLGHMSLCLERLDKHLRKAGVEPELATHFKHLVLSHHGQYEYGSPRLPQTSEAFALHHADNLDAKLTQCRGLFPAEAEADPERPGLWSPWQNTLGRQIYWPPHTPEAPERAPRGHEKKRAPAAEPESRATQCTLLA